MIITHKIPKNRICPYCGEIMDCFVYQDGSWEVECDNCGYDEKGEGDERT